MKKNQQTTKRYAKITKSEIRRPATGNKKKSAGGKRRLRSAMGNKRNQQWEIRRLRSAIRNKKIAVENQEKDWQWEIKKEISSG